MINELVLALRARGHDVGLVAHRDSTCEATARFDWPTMRGTLNRLKVISRAVKDFEPSLVHSFSRLAYLAPLMCSRHLPKIMSFQREPTPRTVRWASRLARGSLAFTGCSEYITNKGRVAGGRWQTIHNFVDLERYTFVPEVADDAPLVFLSRVEPIKGAHIAIEVCRAAGRQLIIAGNHSEEDTLEARYWREEIEPRIDGTAVEYVGAVNDAQKNELLGQAAAMLVPIQWNEPFGIVFAEALACGTPVISCPRGALPEIVTDREHGFLATSVPDMIAAIQHLPTIRREACRGRAVSKFSSDVVVSEYERLYEKIAAAA